MECEVECLRHDGGYGERRVSGEEEEVEKRDVVGVTQTDLIQMADPANDLLKGVREYL